MKLYRQEEGKMISGVCGGLAEYFNIDPSIVRILLVLATFLEGVFFFLYIFASIILPVKDSRSEIYREEDKKDASKDNEKGEKTLGLILIAGGFLLFARRFIPYLDINYILPAALIIIGVLVIAKGRGRRDEQE